MDAGVAYDPEGCSENPLDATDGAQAVEVSTSADKISKSTFPFLKLPGEIRTEIYSYPLKADGVIYLRIHNVDRIKSPRYESHTVIVLLEKSARGWYRKVAKPLAAEVPSDGIGLLLTCKEIYQEAIGVLYAENKFTYFDSLVGFHPRHSSWLRQIGTSNKNLIKDFSLRIPAKELGYGPHTVLKRHWGSATQFAQSLPKGLESLGFGAAMECGQINQRCDAPNYWPARRSSLLRVAAQITEAHPILKRSLWQAGNGLRHCEDRSFPGKILSPSTATYSAIGGKLVTRRDLVLDCAKIRRLTREELERHDELKFALPDDALSSEPSPDD